MFGFNKYRKYKPLIKKFMDISIKDCYFIIELTYISRTTLSIGIVKDIDFSYSPSLSYNCLIRYHDLYDYNHKNIMTSNEFYNILTTLFSFPNEDYVKIQKLIHEPISSSINPILKTLHINPKKDVFKDIDFESILRTIDSNPNIPNIIIKTKTAIAFKLK